MVLTRTASFTDDLRAFKDPVVFGMDSATPLADILRDLYTPAGRYYTDATFSAVRPGTAFDSSEFGILLAAYAIELDVAKPFHEYVQEQIFEPLGMEATSYFLRDLPEDRLAVGYTCDPRGSGFACLPTGDPNGTLLDQQHSFPQYPLALLRTSATQYLKFVAMLMNDGRVGSRSILTKASVDQLFEPSPIRAFDGLEQGIIFLSLGDQGLWGNGGLDLGVAASVSFDRNSRVGAIAIGNSEDSANTHYRQMRRIVSKLVTEFR
jgi:CubicO group peptidase (beta-lactamase class C family)